MKAQPGDRLVIKGHKVGEHERVAEVLEARGEDGGPPFRIRWAEDEHETLLFPGPDAEVQHHPTNPTA
ncbi:MAG: DUF1918 domain-containing protein [Nitriliruptorales bacterium]|nr:DUF1918 domain-containing protein [Nitriliruptorales bacterium]